mmetsp:Transcript_12910/g.34643  ORF Transcript_12910/g.34643 Transcript_12910/m.34643 type:complete len:339 (-) Transcript_12910:92-1108(-)
MLRRYLIGRHFAAPRESVGACRRAQLPFSTGGSKSQNASPSSVPHGRRPAARNPKVSAPSPLRCPEAAQTDVGRPGMETLIAALQGQWGDDIGLAIEVCGNEARFSDGTEPWPFEQVDGDLTLRGAKLVGTVSAPMWRFPTGVERHWARNEVFGSGDAVWRESFLSYKEERLQLRRLLHKAFASNDFDQVFALKSAWSEDHALPGGLSEQQKSALVTGRWLVSGSCFRHKKFNYRGVVLGCEPWCTYPTAWRARWVPNRPQGEAQPYYICAVDERDREGTQSRYVAEENMEEDSMAFPVQSRLVDALFEQCNGAGSYLPKPQLEDALRRQRASGVFAV